MIRNIRVGIPIIGGQHWLGGVTYVEALVRAIRTLPDAERPRAYLIVQPETQTHLPLHWSFLNCFDGIVTIGLPKDAIQANGCSVESLNGELELNDLIDFRYPLPCNVLPGICSGSWIPDFQHVLLPEFFSAEEITLRNRLFGSIAQHAALVVVSSHDAANDFRQIYPRSEAAVRVLPFHAMPPKSIWESNPEEARRKYGLPNDYLICCNQFWKHKNHLTLFEAVARLIGRGENVNLVCTGSTEDYRHADYFRIVRDRLRALGIENRVWILGMIPRDDQLQLIRGSRALVQPSLFEGWSTVVEDGRALGKTMILSDLPVHHEQNPLHAQFFRRESTEDLMRAIHETLAVTGPGRDEQREEAAQSRTQFLVHDFGRQFCRIVMEAHFLYGRKPRSMSDNLWRLLSDSTNSTPVFQLTNQRN